MSRLTPVVGGLVLAFAASARAEPQPPTAQCTSCHAAQREQFAASVHKALKCTECHGGEDKYAVSAEQAKFYEGPAVAGQARPAFDHGAKFTGKAPRGEVPQLCGACHADVARMNPFGIRTDQLSAYWTSGHGKTLKEKGDDRVAVCIDCHGVHDILKSSEPTSMTHPLNVPGACGRCHADESLMKEFKLPTAIVDEYHRSVHGKLLFEQGDTGAPTCATCHGNHAAAPPGFASVRSVCGQCHQHAAENFSTSIHASQDEHKGCVQCHGGGPDAHYHLIDRITKPTGLMIQRYAHLISTHPTPTTAQVAQAIHAEPEQIIRRALPTCTACHEAIEEDKSLPKLFDLIKAIAAAERKYVETASYLDRVGSGVLLVDNQRFKFDDAKTHLIALAPLQHTLNNKLVEEKVKELNVVCDEVQGELAALEQGLRWRYLALIPIWGFACLFSVVLHAKYKLLRAEYVKPLPGRGSH